MRLKPCHYGNIMWLYEDHINGSVKASSFDKTEYSSMNINEGVSIGGLRECGDQSFWHQVILALGYLSTGLDLVRVFFTLIFPAMALFSPVLLVLAALKPLFLAQVVFAQIILVLVFWLNEV